MENRKITGLMLSHHGLLEVLFAVFRDNVIKKSESAKDALMKFKWEEAKHIFTEEAAIFSFTNWKNGEIMKTVENLEKQHRIILNMLSTFETNIPKEDDGDLINLYKLLVEHRKTEEEILYPAMETELTEEEKEKVIAKINEIPLRK